MTAPKNDGGPAFPPVHNPETHPSGMTLRDYFAAAAVQGRLSNPHNTAHPDYTREGLAAECYAIADAMLKARAK